MKKLLILFLLIAVLMTIPFQQSSAAERLIFATFPEGGALYSLGAGLVTTVNKHTKIKATIQGVGPPLKWRTYMESGAVDMGSSNSADFTWAYHSIGPFEGQPRWEQLRLVHTGFDIYRVVYTRKKDNIQNVSELKGKRIGAINPGSPGITLSGLAVLEAAGITKDNSKILSFSSPSEASAALIEGRMDAFIYGITSVWQEIDRAVGCRLVPLTPDQQKKANKIQPAYSPSIMPAGLYEYPEAVPSIGEYVAVVASKNVSENVIYQTGKAIWENFDEYKATHPRAKDFSLDRALRKIGLPYHPGTIKYLKEKGMWTDEWNTYNKEQLK